MNIFIKPYRGSLYNRDGLFSLATPGNPFYSRQNFFFARGINLHTFDYCHDPASAAGFIFCDLPYPWEFSAWTTILRFGYKSVLLTFESPQVNPFNHHLSLLRLFRRVYIWNDDLIDNQNIVKFFYPQVTRPRLPHPARSKLLTFISSQKHAFLPFRFMSPYHEDLYPLRLRLIKELETNFPNQFEFYGRGWNQSSHPAYRGLAANKLAILSRYKFALCVENTPAPGYITEKIFDCFQAGCVPVYLGAPNITSFIPSDCFIDLRNYSSVPDLMSFLSSVSPANYQAYQRRITTFLASKTCRHRWFEPAWNRLFSDIFTLFAHLAST